MMDGNLIVRTEKVSREVSVLSISKVTRFTALSETRTLTGPSTRHTTRSTSAESSYTCANHLLFPDGPPAITPAPGAGTAATGVIMTKDF